MKTMIPAIMVFAFLSLSSREGWSLPPCPYSPTTHYWVYKNWTHCEGTIAYSDGDKYVGEFRNGFRHGSGTYTYADGSKYVGEFKNEKFHGQGTRTLKDGYYHGQATFIIPRKVTRFAKWRKVSVSVDGTAVYVDFERIRKHDGYVYYWDLFDLLKPSKDEDLSYKAYMQGDCKLLRKKTLSEVYHKESMGGGTGTMQILTKFQKDWKYPPPNSLAKTILKSVCEYAKYR